MESALGAAVVLLPVAYLLLAVDYGFLFFTGRALSPWGATVGLKVVLTLHLVYLVLVTVRWQQLPAANVSQGLSIVAFSVIVVYAIVERLGNERSTGFWLVAIAFFFTLLSSISGHHAAAARAAPQPALLRPRGARAGGLRGIRGGRHLRLPVPAPLPRAQGRKVLALLRQAAAARGARAHDVGRSDGRLRGAHRGGRHRWCGHARCWPPGAWLGDIKIVALPSSPGRSTPERSCCGDCGGGRGARWRSPAWPASRPCCSRSRRRQPLVLRLPFVPLMPIGSNRRDAQGRELRSSRSESTHRCAPLDLRERVAYGSATARTCWSA